MYFLIIAEHLYGRINLFILENYWYTKLSHDYRFFQWSEINLIHTFDYSSPMYHRIIWHEKDYKRLDLIICSSEQIQFN